MNFVGLRCFVRFIGEDCNGGPFPPLPPVPGPLDFVSENTNAANITATFDLAKPFAVLEIALRYQGTLTNLTATHGGEALQLVRLDIRDADKTATAIFIGNGLTVESAQLVVTPVGGATVGPAIGRINDDFTADIISAGWKDGATGYGDLTSELTVSGSSGGGMKHVWGATLGSQAAVPLPADEHERLTWGRVVGGTKTLMNGWNSGNNWNSAGGVYTHTGSGLSSISESFTFTPAGPIGFSMNATIAEDALLMVTVYAGSAMTQRQYQGPVGGFSGKIYDLVEGISEYTRILISARGNVSFSNFNRIQNPIQILGAIGRSVGAIANGDTIQYQAAQSGPYSLTAAEIVGYSYDPDASSLFSRMTVQPNGARKALYNSLIMGLKSAGIWSKLDGLWITAAHDAQAARLNIKTLVFNAVSNTPTYNSRSNSGITGTYSAGSGGAAIWTFSGTATTNLTLIVPLSTVGSSAPLHNYLAGEAVTIKTRLNLNSGSLANVSGVRVGFSEYTGVTSRGSANSSVISITATPANYEYTRTINNALTDNITPNLVVNIVSGMTVNFSLRVESMQMAKTSDLIAVNSPTYTTDKGYAGNGSNSYLNSCYIPSRGATYAQNSAHVGLWVNTTIGGKASSYENGADLVGIKAHDSTTVAGYRVNDTVNLTATNAVLSAYGYSVANRNSSSSKSFYKDSVLVDTVGTSSSTVPTSAFFIGGLNNAGTLANPSSRRICASHIGGSLTSTEIANLNTLLNTFLIGVGATYEQDVRQLIGRMQLIPVDARLDLINSTITQLKNAGLWSKMDAIYFMSAHNSQAATLNWKANQYNLTLVNSPAFQTDRGFTGNGTTSYVDTGLVSNTSVNFKGADNHFLSRANGEAAELNGDSGNSNTAVNLKVQANVTKFQNSGPNSDSLGSPTGIRYIGMSRQSAANFVAFISTASAKTNVPIARSGNATVSDSVLIGARNGFSAPTSYSARQYSFTSLGSGLTVAQMESLIDIVQAYQVAVGNTA